MRMRMLWMRMGDDTALNMKFSIKDLFSKYDQICRKQRTWSHLLKKSLMENLCSMRKINESCNLVKWGELPPVFLSPFLA